MNRGGEKPDTIPLYLTCIKYALEMLLYYREDYCTIPLFSLNVEEMGSRVWPCYIIYHNEKYTWYYEHCPIESFMCEFKV